MISNIESAGLYKKATGIKPMAAIKVILYTKLKV